MEIIFTQFRRSPPYKVSATSAEEMQFLLVKKYINEEVGKPPQKSFALFSNIVGSHEIISLRTESSSQWQLCACTRVEINKVNVKNSSLIIKRHEFTVLGWQDFYHKTLCGELNFWLP